MKKLQVTSLGTPQTGRKLYSRFRGVDYSGDETKIDDSRSPSSVNLIADEGGYPEKRVGWRTIETFTGCISLIVPFEAEAAADAAPATAKEPAFIIHAGDRLYRLEKGEKTELLTGLKEGGRDASFFMGGKLYILTGAEYLVYDGKKASRVEEVAYVPTTTYGRKPAGGGNPYEKVNLLSGYRINKFTADGTSTSYFLDVDDIDATFVPEVTVDGKKETLFTTDYKLGRLTFQTAPAKPKNEGTDNVTVKFRKKPKEGADFVKKCTICATYGLNSDSRVFVSGNPDEPNREQYSGLMDPTYMPDSNYILIGDKSFAIMCYLKSQGELLAVKEDNRQEGTIWHHTAELTGETMTFPLREGLPGYGAAARFSAGNLLDDPLYLSPRGVYAPTMTISGTHIQRALKCRSRRINPRLTKENLLADAVSVCWKGWYVLVVDGHAYVADGNQSRADEGYEWYFWDNIPAHVLRARGQNLYFGTRDGRFCRFNDDLVDEENKPLMRAYNDDGAAIPVEWMTKMDMIDTTQQKKTMLKRGSGIHLKACTRSSVEAWIRTDADHGRFIRTLYADRQTFLDVSFERFTFSSVLNNFKPFRYKAKKWIAVQVLLRQNTANEGFGVNGVEIRYVYGNYLKR